MEHGAEQFVKPANRYNEGTPSFGYGHLYIMRQLSQPTTKQALIDAVAENLNIVTTTADGLKFNPPARFYVRTNPVRVGGKAFFCSGRLII